MTVSMQTEQQEQQSKTFRMNVYSVQTDLVLTVNV